MIRIAHQEYGSPSAPAVFEPPHHRHAPETAGRFIETEYFCGCKSHDPHAPVRCQIHGDPIRLTRIIDLAAPRSG